MSRTGELQRRFEAAFMPNYGVPPVALVRGEGCRVWDADGRQYTDLIAGIAVSALGHAHPALTEAVARQVSTIAHTSNLFLHETEVALAERLLRLLGTGGKVFFTNSGTEANEAAVKLVRRHQGPSRPVFVAAENSFQGRTMGSLALTGKAAIRESFGPFGIDARFVPYGDLAALTSAVTGECAAVFLEPCQGEAGVVPPPAGYLRGAREACDAAGALRKGDHGSTFGGNPVACAAALAVLDSIERDGLLAHAASVGRYLARGIAGTGHPLLAGVRGEGLWLAAVLAQPVAGAVEAACRDAGFLVNAVQPDAIRLAPPLILSDREAGAFLAAFPGILARAAVTEEAPASGQVPAAGRIP